MTLSIKKTFRYSKISGIPVRTQEQEDVGVSEDVALNPWREVIEALFV